MIHQCFYSKRSMYLALFRLIDGEKGIDELEPWLRSVQVVLYKKYDLGIDNPLPHVAIFYALPHTLCIRLMPLACQVATL